MSYYDLSLGRGLAALGANVVVVGSDRPLIQGDRRDLQYRDWFARTSVGPRLSRALRYCIALMKLVARAYRHRPDVIHWLYIEVPLLDIMAMGAIRMISIHQVFTAHETVPWRGQFSKPFMRAIYRTVDLVVVHDKFAAKSLQSDFGLGHRRVHVTGHGDYDGFADPTLPQPIARERIGLPRDVAAALFFGSLRPSKGLDDLIDAWPAVVGAVPRARLIIAGRPYRGVNLRAIRSRIHQLGVADSVVLRLEDIPDLEANDYFAAADVVVLPYRAIGTSGVLRYAYSAARPVVATAVGEHPRHVIPGATGWLPPPGDAEALIRCLIEALGNRDTARAMGKHGLALARERFSWARIASATLDGYERLASR